MDSGPLRHSLHSSTVRVIEISKIKPESDENIAVRAVSNLSMADIEPVHLMMSISRMLRLSLSGCRGNKPQGKRRSEVFSGWWLKC
jgi:hypothetical protein